MWEKLVQNKKGLYTENQWTTIEIMTREVITIIMYVIFKKEKCNSQLQKLTQIKIQEDNISFMFMMEGSTKHTKNIGTVFIFYSDVLKFIGTEHLNDHLLSFCVSLLHKREYII